MYWRSLLARMRNNGSGWTRWLKAGGTILLGIVKKPWLPSGKLRTSRFPTTYKGHVVYVRHLCVDLHNKQYLDEFSKSLANEVRMLLNEVGKLREEKRNIQL